MSVVAAPEVESSNSAATNCKLTDELPGLVVIFIPSSLLSIPEYECKNVD